MKKKSLFMSIALLIFTIVIIVGTTYAYFSGMDDNQEMVVASVSAKELKLEYSDGQNIDINDVLPGATIIKRFSVKNTGTEELEYTVYLEDVINEFGKKSELVYSLESDEGISLDQRMFPATDKAIAMNVKISAGETHNYSLKIHFININDYQDANMNKQVSAVLQVDGRRPPVLENSVTMTVADGVESELRGIFGDGFNSKNKVDKVTINGTDVTNDYLNNNYEIEYGTGDVIKVYFSESLTYLYYMFSETTYSTIDLHMLDTSNVTDMSWMFSDCSNLTSIDVSNFDTSNVTNMSDMFYYCSNLTSLDVSNFDTSNVTKMYGMFSHCSNLTSLDVSNFDTSNVTDMSWMFYDCSNLTSLDVSNFDTSNVTDISGMFYDCSNLTSLDVSNFDTSNVTDMSHMFYGCSNLTNLDISNFDTSNVTKMSWMFSDCSNLTSLDVSNFDTNRVTNMSGMFSDCSSLTSLDVSNFETTSLEKINFFISSNYSLQKLNLGNFNIVGKIDEQYISMSFADMPSTLKIIYNSNYLVDSRIDLSSFQTCDLATNTCEGFLD